MTQEQNDGQAQEQLDSKSAQSLFAGYGGEELPLAQYAELVGIYGAGLAAFLLAAKNSNRQLPENIGAGDILLLGVATHKLSRLISKDRVTAPFRAPFVEYEGSAGTSELKEKPRGSGMQRALGDLLTCPWCMGAWVAAGLTYGFVFRPRATRLIGSILAVTTISDWLNSAYEAAKKEAK